MSLTHIITCLILYVLLSPYLLLTPLLTLKNSSCCCCLQVLTMMFNIAKRKRSRKSLFLDQASNILSV